MQKPLLFLISGSKGPRLSYVVKEIFGRRLGISPQIVDFDSEVPENSIIISYGKRKGHIQFPDQGLIQQSWKTPEKQIFTTQPAIKSHSSFVWNFDFPGHCFHFLARLEEYENFASDSHGRFPESASFFAKNKIMEEPWIDIWTSILHKQLKELGIETKKPEFEEHFTFDIDNLTAFRHKGWIRNLAGFSADLAMGRIQKCFQRVLCLGGFRTDPYDNMDYIIQQLKESEISSTFFIWIGDYGPNDKGLHWQNSYFRKRIREISHHFELGIHPSYRCLKEPERLRIEINRLENLIEKKVTKSRFHFLRFQLPHSLQLLEKGGILEDHSMGFSNAFGYRAATCQPFRFYDISQERETDLTIFPFALMDSTAKYALQLREEQWEKHLWQQKQLLKNLGGRMEIVLHNDITGNTYPFPTLSDLVMNPKSK